MEFSFSISLGFPPLARFFHPERFAFSDHARNAKLIFEVTLHPEALSSGIYSRPELRFRRRLLPPVTAKLSSNEDRNV